MQTAYEKYLTERARESRKASRVRYTFWTLFIIAVFAFLIGVLVGATH